MIPIEGKCETATVFTDFIDDVTKQQIEEFCDQEIVRGTHPAFMSDTHAGKGCVIGTTMQFRDYIVPNWVGVDISCGMHVVKLDIDYIDLKKFDDFIKTCIPSGFNVNKIRQAELKDIDDLICKPFIEVKEYNFALGSLGGGNHFIEIDCDTEKKDLYLVIHSGSRNLGLQVANYWQGRAVEHVKELYETQKRLIKKSFTGAEVGVYLQSLKDKLRIKDDLCYLDGELAQDYLHDMAIAGQFAALNRETMARRIVEQELNLNYDACKKFETLHNYIDIKHNLLRKGAVSAMEGETLIIPMNMRDGSLICKGKGNPNWNYSAPHGAGRVMGRIQAKATLNFEDFKQTMTGIYSTSVTQDTIDESPMVYKPMNEIMANIKDTVDIVGIIKPIYNFKAGGE